MDISKLYEEGAMSIAKDITENYLVVAGGEEETMLSLVMKKMMEMVTKSRKKSISKMAGTLREAQGKNRFLEQTQEGLRERIAGYQEAQEKQSDSALMKQMKEIRWSERQRWRYKRLRPSKTGEYQGGA